MTALAAALGLGLGLAAFCAVVARPRWGAYLWLAVNPLVVGIARGNLFPLMRPNELLLVLILAALATRVLLVMLARQTYRLPVDRMDAALILLAATSSILPMALRYGRGLPVTGDDILYAVVLWKYYLLYRVFRDGVATTRQVGTCLRISMASGGLVAVIGMMQVAGLFGVAELLHAVYDQPFEGYSGVLTERATSTIGSSFGFADMMVMNFIIAVALFRQGLGDRRLLAGAAVLFTAGCVAAGTFSGYIGFAVAALAFGFLSGYLFRLLMAGLPAATVAVAAFWPVIERRLAGFDRPSGLPHSWTGRWENLERFFFPELFSGVNWLVGVRPAPRLPASESWRDFIYIESGYVWLLWIGGLPLLAAFAFFVWAGGHRLMAIARERDDEVAALAAACFAYLVALAALMLLDPHLTVRGAADLFFPLLALCLVRARAAGAPALSRARASAASGGPGARIHRGERSPHSVASA